MKNVKCKMRTLELKTLNFGFKHLALLFMIVIEKAGEIHIGSGDPILPG